MKKISLIASVAFSAFVFASCASISQITDATLKVAQENGMVSEAAAESISQSAGAIEKAAETITPEMEYYIGRAVAGTLFTRYKYYNAPAAQAYLNNIVNTLALNSESSVPFNGYCVAILDTDELNAFATPGGHILVTRGLLKNTKSEDEVAAVLAHEVSHVELKHSVSAIKTSRRTTALLKTAGAVATSASKDQERARELVAALDDSVGSIVSNLVDSGFSQSQEFDADRNALKLLSASGYDPMAMDTMLNMLKANTKGGSGFGKTHPKPQDRISKIAPEYGKYAKCSSMGARAARFKKNSL